MRPPARPPALYGPPVYPGAGQRLSFGELAQDRTQPWPLDLADRRNRHRQMFPGGDDN